MFDDLLASRPRPERSTGSIVLSVLAHIVLIVAASESAGGVPPRAEPREPPRLDTFWVTTPEHPARPPVRPSPAPRFPRQPVPLPAPFDVPDVALPDDIVPRWPGLEAAPPVVGRDDFARYSQRGLDAPRGLEGLGRSGGPARDVYFFEFAVERPAVAAPGNPRPRYPEPLREAGVEGRVLVQFVVDTTGRADLRTFRARYSDHELFTRAVELVLPAMRFLPAEHGGRKVRVLVEQNFYFELARPRRWKEEGGQLPPSSFHLTSPPSPSAPPARSPSAALAPRPRAGGRGR